MAQTILNANQRVSKGFRLQNFHLSFGAFIMTNGTVNGIKNLGSWCGKTESIANATIKVKNDMAPTVKVEFF